MTYDDYIIQMEQQRLGPDCDCAEGECDACQDENCDCTRHEEDCEVCKTTRGCRCDTLYEDWKDRQYA